MGNYDCIILCGGKSSRLGNLSKHLSKVLINIDYNSSFEMNLINISNLKFNKLFVNICNNKKIFDSIISKYPLVKHRTKLIKEVKPSGTSGVLLNKKININNIGNLLVIYGDTISKINLEKVVNYYFKIKSNFLMVVHRKKNVKHSGVCVLQKNKLISFIEKKNKNTSKSLWVNSGIYLISNKYLSKLKSEHFDFAIDFIPFLINKKLDIDVYKTRSKFFTIDNSKQLNETRQYFKSN